MDALNQTQPVVAGNRDKPARDFGDVKADLSTFVDVARNGFRALGKHMFDKASRRYENVVIIWGLIVPIMQNHLGR